MAQNIEKRMATAKVVNGLHLPLMAGRPTSDEEQPPAAPARGATCKIVNGLHLPLMAGRPTSDEGQPGTAATEPVPPQAGSAGKGGASRSGSAAAAKPPRDIPVLLPPSAATVQSGPTEYRKRRRADSEAGNEEEHENVPSERPIKKARRANEFTYFCRHRCLRNFNDAAALRAHHHKVHNSFFDGTAYERPCFCGKKFATEKEYNKHMSRDNFFNDCGNSKRPSGDWNVPVPQTDQERADIWAYKQHGEPSKDIKVPNNENGEPRYWPQFWTDDQAATVGPVDSAVESTSSQSTGTSADPIEIGDEDDQQHAPISTKDNDITPDDSHVDITALFEELFPPARRFSTWPPELVDALQAAESVQA